MSLSAAVKTKAVFPSAFTFVRSLRGVTMVDIIDIHGIRMSYDRLRGSSNLSMLTGSWGSRKVAEVVIVRDDKIGIFV